MSFSLMILVILLFLDGEEAFVRLWEGNWKGLKFDV